MQARRLFVFLWMLPACAILFTMWRVSVRHIGDTAVSTEALTIFWDELYEDFLNSDSIYDICIASSFLGKHQVLLDVTLPNKAEYANKHGYFISAQRTVNEHTRDTRSLHYQKLPFIAQLLVDCDWVFWSDADAIFNQLDIKLEDIISQHKGAELIFTREETLPQTHSMHHALNTGHFFVKRTLFALNFLRESFLVRHSHPHWNDQASITLLVKKLNDPRVHFAPHRAFNSLFPEDWRPHDFVLHSPGCFGAFAPDACAAKLKALLAAR